MSPNIIIPMKKPITPKMINKIPITVTLSTSVFVSVSFSTIRSWNFVSYRYLTMSLPVVLSLKWAVF